MGEGLEFALRIRILPALVFVPKDNRQATTNNSVERWHNIVSRQF